VVDLHTAPDILKQNQREFGYVCDALRGFIARVHKLFYLVPMYKFYVFTHHGVKTQGQPSSVSLSYGLRRHEFRLH
jgi:hypothetical protein